MFNYNKELVLTDGRKVNLLGSRINESQFSGLLMSDKARDKKMMKKALLANGMWFTFIVLIVVIALTVILFPLEPFYILALTPLLPVVVCITDDSKLKFIFSKKARLEQKYEEYSDRYIFNTVLNHSSSHETGSYSSFQEIFIEYAKSISDDELKKIVELCLTFYGVKDKIENIDLTLNKQGGLPALRSELEDRKEDLLSEQEHLKRIAKKHYKKMVEYKETKRDNEISEEIVELLAS